MLFTGYFLGRYIPGIDEHIELVIIAVVFLSILPGIIHWYRERKRTVTVLPVDGDVPGAVPEPVLDRVRDKVRDP
jgi:membrane-associated protein